MVRSGFGGVIALALVLGVAGCEPPAPGTPGSAPAASGAAPAAAAAATTKPRGMTGAEIKQIELQPGQVSSGQTAAVRVEFAIDGFPAQAAGLRPGDIILSIAGKPVDTPIAVIKIETEAGPTATLPFVVLRDGQQQTIDITLVPVPADYDAKRRDYLLAQMKAEDEAAGAALQAGEPARAFEHDMRALRLSFYAPVTPGEYDRLLANAAALLPRLQTRPVIPSEADRHNRRALALLHAARTQEDDDRAAGEFGDAVYEAPWIQDLYLNLALTQEKAGSPEAALTDLRRYLILNPAPRDLDAIKQKLAELEVLADERKPWLPFVGRIWTNSQSGAQTRMDLRGRDLTLTIVKPAGESFAAYPANYPALRAVIHGHDFQGTWHARSGDDATKKCYGTDFDMESFGGLDPTGSMLKINARARNFNTNSCQETGSSITNLLNYNRPPAAQ